MATILVAPTARDQLDECIERYELPDQVNVVTVEDARTSGAARTL